MKLAERGDERHRGHRAAALAGAGNCLATTVNAGSYSTAAMTTPIAAQSR